MKSNVFRASLLVFGITLFTSNIFGQGKHERPEKPPTVEQLFKDLDANEDGKLSKKEIKGPLKDHFSKIDTDEDGFLTKEEIEKSPKPKRKGGAKRG